MTVSKKKFLIMTAVTIVVMLVLIFASIMFLAPNFEIKDGKVLIPSYLKITPPTTTSDDTIEETTSDELTFKGTFDWEEKDGAREEDKGTCYLRIYTFQDEMIAKFSYGKYLIDGWPTFLVSQTGNHYIFESSHNSFVERVRIVVNVTDIGMSGTVENITPEISNFVRGSFKGDSISFEQYAEEVLD